VVQDPAELRSGGVVSSKQHCAFGKAKCCVSRLDGTAFEEKPVRVLSGRDELVKSSSRISRRV
jgi:hypothetical protein